MTNPCRAECPPLGAGGGVQANAKWPDFPPPAPHAHAKQAAHQPPLLSILSSIVAVYLCVFVDLQPNLCRRRPLPVAYIVCDICTYLHASQGGTAGDALRFRHSRRGLRRRFVDSHGVDATAVPAKYSVAGVLLSNGS